MADSIHASYGKIGFAVVAGLVAVIGMLIYIGGLDGKKGVIYAETYSDSPVSGLAVGSDVNMRGVKVGEVKEISFVGSEYEGVAENDIPKIYIRLAIDPRKLRVGAGEDPEEVLRRIVKKGLHATVASSGITGLSKIELNFPKDGIADQRISWVLLLLNNFVLLLYLHNINHQFQDILLNFQDQLLFDNKLQHPFFDLLKDIYLQDNNMMMKNPFLQQFLIN